MSRRVLITGVTGMLGRELALHLRRRGDRVYGCARRPLAHWRDGLEWLPIVCDLADPIALVRAVRLSEPEVIFHLAAAQASATASPSVIELFHVNQGGTLRLLSAVAEAAPKARTIIASTGAVYGLNDGPRQRWHEEAPFRPASPYAASKAAMELAARSMGSSHRLEVVIARLFNLIGPSRRSDSAPAHFARQIAAMEAEGRPRPLGTGNLAAVRDYLDSRDAALALAQLRDLDSPQAVYNICSGRGVRLEWVAQQLWQSSGLPVPTTYPSEGRVDADTGASAGSRGVPDGSQARLDRLVGDPGRLRLATGWAPQVPLADSLARLLDHWRTRTAADGSRKDDEP